MANLYCTREAVKRAGNIHGANYDAQIDRLIEDASRSLDLLTRPDGGGRGVLGFAL